MKPADDNGSLHKHTKSRGIGLGVALQICGRNKWPLASSIDKDGSTVFQIIIKADASICDFEVQSFG